jgi:hypothetical protein
MINLNRNLSNLNIKKIEKRNRFLFFLQLLYFCIYSLKFLIFLIKICITNPWNLNFKTEIAQLNTLILRGVESASELNSPEQISASKASTSDSITIEACISG